MAKMMAVKNPIEQDGLAKDVIKGLSAEKKYLSSKYFYDTVGSQIFNQITRHPDYYLTRCELEILAQYKTALSTFLGDQPFNLVELGPGEGIKSEILLSHFLQKSLDFHYVAIDISEEYLQALKRQLKQKFPSLQQKMLSSDYFEGLEWLKSHSKAKSLVLFLGSSIGNFSHQDTAFFLRKLRADLKEGDYLLIGFDLMKAEELLQKAYNDSAGLTKAFNLNLLTRLNRELQTNFNLQQFSHRSQFNATKNAMESHLISLKKQKVWSPLLHCQFDFKAFETIHTEYSHKYTMPQIVQMAEQAGFKIKQHFQDNKHYFVDSLWQV